MLKNLLDNHYKGNLYAVNPKEEFVQGLPAYRSVGELPEVDLAILAIPAQSCLEAVVVLAREKNTRAFIVISSGFGEMGEEGKALERQLVAVVDEVNGTLIGPNCIGVMTLFHTSVFTTPIPKLSPDGCDFISGSGATAVFIMESGIPKGLRFASVFSVGNCAQVGVEEILQYFDETFDEKKSSKVKLLYIENISNPDKLLFHATSLIKKGCRIAAIKSGTSSSGSRAAQSHTGAMASSDSAVEALFRKAGIVRCYGREELTTVASVFMCKELKGKRMAIITHAGGPGVMLSDALESGGLAIPRIPDSPEKKALKEKLFPGSSVENPIDFLATGTAEQLGEIIDTCENDFDFDGMAVIFGSPGLFPIGDVYRLLDEKMRHCHKPIYPILPSITETKEDVAYFLAHGNVNFPDEVLLGRALTKVMNTPGPTDGAIFMEGIDIPRIRQIISQAKNGFQPPEVIHQLFEATGIPMVEEITTRTEQEAVLAALKIGFPVVMKVVGPVHKTEVGGVVLNVRNPEQVKKEFHHLSGIKGADAVLVSQMAKGLELFLGAKYEEKFGHVILCGLGGIYVEVLKDVASGLAPLTFSEVLPMIKSLRAFRILEGFRGQPGINIQRFAEIIVRLSTLLRFATEIKELDINPLLGFGDSILTVDARIRVEKGLLD
jgi:acetyltransferase